MCVCVFLVQYLSGMKLNGLAALQHSAHGAMIQMVVSGKKKIICFSSVFKGMPWKHRPVMSY